MSSDTGYQIDSELERWLARPRPGYHLWLIYEDAGKQMATIALYAGRPQPRRALRVDPSLFIPTPNSSCLRSGRRSLLCP